MKAYKYITRVSENGTIQIPYNPSLFEKEVEVFIIPKNIDEKIKLKGADFVKKWAGFLNKTDTDNSKFEYLSDKYR